MVGLGPDHANMDELQGSYIAVVADYQALGVEIQLGSERTSSLLEDETVASSED